MLFYTGTCVFINNINIKNCFKVDSNLGISKYVNSHYYKIKRKKNYVHRMQNLKVVKPLYTYYKIHFVLHLRAKTITAHLNRYMFTFLKCIINVKCTAHNRKNYPVTWSIFKTTYFI